MKRALVLGATGHIGAHVVRALLAEGHTVRAASRTEPSRTTLADLPVECVRVDLETGDGLARAVDGCDWVFHAAASYPSFVESPDTALVRAIASTRRALAVIRRAQPTRVVFTSSAAVIRSVEDRPATENDAEIWPVSGRQLYATVKIAVEHEVLQAHRDGLPVILVNPSVCVGEYDARPFSGRLVLVFAKSRMPFYLDLLLNTIYTGDVGIGHVRAAQRGRVGERYLLTTQAVSLKTFATLAARAAGVSPPRWCLPQGAALALATASEALARLTHRDPLLPRQAVLMRQRAPRLDASKARRELALPHTPIDEAISRAVRWFRSSGML